MVEQSSFKSIKKLPFTAQAVGSIGLAFAAAGSLAPNCGGSENKGNQPTAESINRPKISYAYKFP